MSPCGLQLRLSLSTRGRPPFYKLTRRELQVLIFSKGTVRHLTYLVEFIEVANPTYKVLNLYIRNNISVFIPI